MIADWDDAYANGAHIEGAEQFPPRWAEAASSFRKDMSERGHAELDLAYGAEERERVDIFRPTCDARGLFVFVHGGYWMKFDKSTWSHLAKGALERGWAVAIPSYTLSPAARVTEMTRQIGEAITFAAARVEGGLRLAGHLAGGLLVTRMVCGNSPLPIALQARLEHVVSISGLPDLRPLLATRMHQSLRLDAEEAAAESVALPWPVKGARVVCWVGSRERPEFIRQNDLLANIWAGLGGRTRAVHAVGKHHFNVIDDLADAVSELTKLCAP